MLARLRDDYSKYESKFGDLFMKKIDEIEDKIHLIKAYKKQDINTINNDNIRLFGPLDETLIALSKQKIESGIVFSPRDLWPILRTETIVQTIKDHIIHTGLPHTRVRVDQSNLSRLSVWLGKYATIKVASNAVMREYKLLSKLIHEIDVHAARYYHGKMTGRHILTTWAWYYLEDEEGLAMYLAQQFLQMHIPGYDGISKYKNYLAVWQSRRLDRISMGDYILSQKQSIRDTMSGIKSRDHNYRVLFNTILKFKKWLRDTSITDAGISFGKNKVYLSGYQKYHTLVQSDSEQAKDSIKKMLKYGKIWVNDLSYFVS